MSRGQLVFCRSAVGQGNLSAIIAKVNVLYRFDTRVIVPFAVTLGVAKQMSFVCIWEPKIHAGCLKRHTAILPFPRMLVHLKFLSRSPRLASPELSEMSFPSMLQTGDTIALAPWHHQPPSVLSSSPWSIGNASIAYLGSVICSILHRQSRNRDWRM